MRAGLHPIFSNKTARQKARGDRLKHTYVYTHDPGFCTHVILTYTQDTGSHTGHTHMDTHNTGSYAVVPTAVSQDTCAHLKTIRFFKELLFMCIISILEINKIF